LGGSNPPGDSNTTIGLAEYTSANFWTEDTFPWKFNSGNYPHPVLEDTNYDENVWLNPKQVDAEDGVTDKRIYFSKTSDAVGTPFLAAGYWYWQLYMWNKPEVDDTFLLDEKCYEQYAKKLIPRAIGYSAALLDYFFRGTIDPYFGINPILPLISPAFSRDSSKITAIVDKLDMGFNGIIVYDLYSGNWHYLNNFEFWNRKRVNGSAPAWSPVRDEILYYVHQQQDPTTNEMVFDRDIYLINSDGSDNRWLTDDDYTNIQPSWSPGGDWFVFASNRDGEGVMDIWMMDREGGNLKKLRDCTAGCYHPNFSPDGLRLAFEESGDIYSMNLGGSDLKALTTLGDRTTAPAWSPYLRVPTLEVEVSVTTVNPGEPVTLSWTSEFADLAELNDGNGTVSIDTSDTMIFYPTETKTYTIQVSGLGGMVTQAVAIDVITTPPFTP
jgi:hypothetical protein